MATMEVGTTPKKWPLAGTDSLAVKWSKTANVVQQKARVTPQVAFVYHQGVDHYLHWLGSKFAQMILSHI